MKITIMITLILLLHGCAEKKIESITVKSDYDEYLNTDITTSSDAILTEMAFWQSRLDISPTSTIDLSKLAGLHTSLFTLTGDVSQLYKSEKNLKKALQLSTRNKDTYLRSLAHNYISQHRFKEAKILLDSAYNFPDNRRETELMLFDINMELGDYAKADEFLGKVKINGDYNYLIRLSKWSDYKGDWESAIKYMHQAIKIAESSGSTPLKIWTYAAIADYYLHAGRIEDAYSYYLKTLRLAPDNAYAKKGISWIVYVSDKNTAEANRILDSIMVHHKAPEYYLMKAEMAAFNKNHSDAKTHEENFYNALNSSDYGNMYNTHLIELFTVNRPEEALVLARKEIENRAAPDVYKLLGYAQLLAGKKEEALNTIEKYVFGKTNDPMALYYSGLVFKANGLNDRIAPLIKELKNAHFELGPVMMHKIEALK